MRKVTKILVSTLSGIILTVLGLTLTLALLLEIPAFQNFIVHKATGFVSDMLGTKVAIGRVRLKFISRAELQDIYVEDLHGDTLAYIGRLEAGIRNLGLKGGAIDLGEVKLEHTRFYMHQVQMGDTVTSNLGEILAKLKSDKPREKKGGFALQAASIDIEDLAYRYRKLEPETRAGLNFGDIRIGRLDLSADAFSIIEDSISLKINHVSLREDRSGFSVDHLSAGHAIVSSGALRFRDLSIKTPDSELTADYLELAGDSWKSFGSFVDSVDMQAAFDIKRFSYATAAYFAPGLPDWKSVYRDVRGKVSGTVASMRGEVARMRTLDTSIEGVRFDIAGLPDVPRTRFRFDIGSLQTSADDALWLFGDITRGQLPGKTRATLTRLGEVSFKGHFDGTLARFTANGDLATSRGSAGVNLAFTPQTGGLTHIDGRLDVVDFEVGKLIGNPSLGRASVKGEVKGTLGGGRVAMDADARLGLLEFNGYAYHDVDMKGRFENRNFTGRIASADPNIRFDFDGQLDMNDSVPRYDFRLALHRADLHKLNFNRRDSVSMFSAHIAAKGSGNRMDNVNGVVDMDDVVYINPTDTIRTGLMRLTGANSGSGKMLALQSSFADVQFTSRLGYADLFSYLRGALREYIPTLGTGRKSAPRPAAAANAGDFYLLTMKVKEANNIAGAIVPGLIIARGTELSFMLNPRSENLSLTLRSEYLEWGRLFVSNLDLNSRNQGDSLSLFVRAQDLFASGFYMPGLSVIGGVKDDKVRISTRFADNDNGVSAIVTGEALFRSNPSGLRQIVMRLGQSYITNREQTWRLSSGQIVYDSTRVSVERLRIVSSNGELMARGVASRSRQDTLHVHLSNFNLGPMMQFTSRMGYTVSGITNGYADMVSAMKNGMIFSNITFDSLKVNNIQAPPLLFDTRWDLASERIRAVLTDRAGADTLVRFFYRPKDKRYLGEVDIKGLDLALIDPLLAGVLRSSSGRADLALRITSAEGSPVFNGSVRIPRLTTTIDFTNVPYTLSDATLTVKDNTFTLPATPLRDPEGNRADLDAQFALSRGFSNYGYTIGVRPRNFLVLSTTPQQNELFNGRVHASGAATIKGDKRGVTMGITATTAANSTFQMSLSGKSGIGDADFITFVDRKVVADSSYYEKRKRLLMAAPGESDKENSSQLAIDMALEVLPNTEFSLVLDPTMGRGIKARGNGSLNINVNPRDGEFHMYGDYELTEGSYNLNFEQLVDRTFSINPGSVIRWTGDPADALLDVSALYGLKASLSPLVGIDSPYANTRVNTECTITLSDRLIKPNFSFAVEVKDAVPEIQNIVSNTLNTPEATATQFLYLVGFNSFSSDALTGVNMGSANMTSTALNMLTSQFGNVFSGLSRNRVNVGVNYRLAGETTSSELGIDLSTSLGERVFLDIEGNYDMEDNSAAKVNANSSNLTGDFALRYLIDRTGNLQSRIFSRTINTYDENQGLQETGAGIYYHENFNSVGDIRHNIRERFARSKVRRAQQAAEQAAEEAGTQGDTIQRDTTTTAILNNDQKP